MKYCMICGRWNEDSDKFCTGCGASLSQDDAQGNEPSAVQPDASASKPTATQADTPAPKQAALPDVRVCPACGASNEPSSRFCTSCGASLKGETSSQEPPAADPDVRVCPACGASNDLSSRFCTTCGKPLATDSGVAEQTISPDTVQTGTTAASIAQTAATQTSPAPVTAPAASLPPLPSSSSSSNADAATVPIAPVPSSQTSPSAPVPGFTPAPAPMSPTQSVQPPALPTPTPAAPTFADFNGSGTVPNASGKDKSRRIVVAVVACVVVIALIVSGVMVWRSRNTKESQVQSGASAPSASSNSSSTKSPAKKSKSPSAKSTESTSSDTASRVLDKQVMDAIVDTYNSGSSNAAVSVMTSDNLKSYSSSKASYSMNAAGLYLPPWLAYYDLVGGSPAGGYQSVLSSMDNDKANELIDRDGGMDMLNSWLSAHDYNETRFGHLYGDVNASENGYNNTTSSDDAAKMLTQLIAKGEDGLLSYNVTSDGVVVPDGATVHAHRGMGVGDAYDYFMVVSNGSKKVVVVVLTEGQTKEQAASLTSNVLKQVWQKMFVSGK